MKKNNLKPASYDVKNLINFNRPNLWMRSVEKSNAGHFPAVQVTFCLLIVMALVAIIKIWGGF